MPPTALPPGPPRRLLSGNLREFSQDILGFLERTARQYGPIASIRLGPRTAYMVGDPDLVEQVLVHKARHFQKSYAFRLNRLLLGNGLVTSDGPFWLRQRRLIQPAFQRERLAAYTPVMTDYTEQMMNGWRDGEVRDVYSDMAGLTLRIITRTMFGADVLTEAPEVGAALEDAQDCFRIRFHSMLPLPEWVPTPTNLRLRRAVRRLDAVVYRFIEQGRRRSPGEAGDDLLSRLLHARDEDGNQMTDVHLRDEIMTMFLAGHDTTALTLSWAFYLLARHPEIEARLAEEVARVLQGRSPTFADLPRLRYVEHVVTESMRLYPPVYAFSREAAEPCELGGYPVSKGRTVMMSQWVLHRDPRYFTEPERFDPSRWEGDLAKRIPRFAYFPFGGGPRQCIGNTFAMIEAVLILAAVVRRFRLEPAGPEPVRPRPSITLRPDGPVRLKVQARPLAASRNME